MKRASGAELVVGRDHADRPVAGRRAAPRAPCARRAARVTSRSTSGSSSTESTRSLRPRSSTRPLFDSARGDRRPEQLVRASRRPRRRSAARSGPPAARPHEPRVEQLAQPPRDEVEQAVEIGLGRERVADLVQRLELPRPARRRLVQARVLDRDRRLRREQLDELLVLLGEVLAVRPSRSGRGCRRRPRAAGSARRGTSSSADGSAGSRPSADRRRIAAGAAGARRVMSAPRIPRPRGRSPIAACVSSSMPGVTKRSSCEPAASITPSAA